MACYNKEPPQHCHSHNVECFFSLFKHPESKQSRLIWWQSSAGHLGFSLVAFHTLGYWSKMAHQGTGPVWGKPVRGHVFSSSLQGQGLELPQSCPPMSHWPELSHIVSSATRKAGKCSLNLEVMGTAKIREFYHSRKEGRVDIEFSLQAQLPWSGTKPGAMHTAFCLLLKSWKLAPSLQCA